VRSDGSFSDGMTVGVGVVKRVWLIGREGLFEGSEFGDRERRVETGSGDAGLSGLR